MQPAQQLCKAFHFARRFQLCNGGALRSPFPTGPGVRCELFAAAATSAVTCTFLVLSELHVLDVARPHPEACHLLQQIRNLARLKAPAITPVLIVGIAAGAIVGTASLFSAELMVAAPDAAERLAILQQACVAPALTKSGASEATLKTVATASAGVLPRALRGAVNVAALAALARGWSASHLGCAAESSRSFCRALQRVLTLSAAYPASSDSNRSVEAWNDVGGLHDVVCSLRQAVEGPLWFQAEHAVLHLKPPRGVLLYGPPGNAKTTLVRALARSVSATFVSVTGADIYSSFVGEAERKLRSVFRRARASAPTILFLDEVDALVGSRGISSSSGGGSGEGTCVRSDESLFCC